MKRALLIGTLMMIGVGCGRASTPQDPGGGETTTRTSALQWQNTGNYPAVNPTDLIPDCDVCPDHVRNRPYIGPLKDTVYYRSGISSKDADMGGATMALNPNVHGVIGDGSMWTLTLTKGQGGHGLFGSIPNMVYHTMDTGNVVTPWGTDISGGIYNDIGPTASWSTFAGKQGYWINQGDSTVTGYRYATVLGITQWWTFTVHMKAGTTIVYEMARIPFACYGNPSCYPGPSLPPQMSLSIVYNYYNNFNDSELAQNFQNYIWQ